MGFHPFEVGICNGKGLFVCSTIAALMG